MHRKPSTCGGFSYGKCIGNEQKMWFNMDKTYPNYFLKFMLYQEDIHATV
jgi:hypothetical protein